jgi:hypothetical protein
MTKPELDNFLQWLDSPSDSFDEEVAKQSARELLVGRFGTAQLDEKRKEIIMCANYKIKKKQPKASWTKCSARWMKSSSASKNSLSCGRSGNNHNDERRENING